MSALGTVVDRKPADRLAVIPPGTGAVGRHPQVPLVILGDSREVQVVRAEEALEVPNSLLLLVPNRPISGWVTWQTSYRYRVLQIQNFPFLSSTIDRMPNEPPLGVLVK